MIQKLNCMYFVAKKVSLPNVDFMFKKEKSEDKDGGVEMYTRFSTELNDLINLYFSISKEGKQQFLNACRKHGGLDSRQWGGEKRHDAVGLHWQSQRKGKCWGKESLFDGIQSEIKAILRDYHEGETANKDIGDRMKALDLVKILMGIYSERVTVKRYMNESKYYAQF